jgi:dihydrofolate reductase
MKLSLIVAIADNGVIGRDQDLPWRLSADLQRFKRLTMGHYLLVGRKTIDSIGRALPGRSMVAISRGRPPLPGGVARAGSLEEGIEIARRGGDDEAFVAGGAEIFRLALPLADRLYLTRVHASVEGDALFQAILDELDLPADPAKADRTSGWHLLEREEVPAGERDEHPTTFEIWERSR